MEARARPIGRILEERTRFCVPVYQRHYEWDKKEQWAPLWEDIKEKGEEVLAGASRRYAHYMGALIISEGRAFHGRVPVKQVIDGQQRLTTFQLFLNALRRVAEDRGYEKIAALTESYIVNDKVHLMEDPDTEIYKLWPTQYDREVYRDVSNLSLSDLRKKYHRYYYQNGNLIFGQAPRTLHCLHFYMDKIRSFVDSDIEETEPEQRLSALLEAVADQFSIVVISLDEGDDAQTIFATLNARGKPLSAMDLIRNDIFHRAVSMGENAEALFASRWQEFEDRFWDQEERQGRYTRKRIEYFLSNVLAAELGEEVNLSKLYPEYRAYADQGQFPTVHDEISHLLSYVPAYRGLVTPTGDDLLSNIARELAVWDITTAFPLILAVERELTDNESDREAIYLMLRSLVVRRALADLGSKNYNRLFLAAVKYLREHGFSADNFARFVKAQQGSSTRFPSDTEFKEGILTTPIYRAGWERRTKLILQTLETARRTRFDDPIKFTDKATVEHVLPTEWAKSWPLPDGTIAPTQSVYLAALKGLSADTINAIQLRENLKNTLGNLTLVTQPLNSRLSNGAFAPKREHLKNSALVLNRDVVQRDEWGEDAIRDRGASLAETAITIWPMPTVTELASEAAT